MYFAQVTYKVQNAGIKISVEYGIWDNTGSMSKCQKSAKCGFLPKKQTSLTKYAFFSLKIQSSTPIPFSAHYFWEKNKQTKVIDLDLDGALNSWKVCFLLKRKKENTQVQAFRKKFHHWSYQLWTPRATLKTCNTRY